MDMAPKKITSAKEAEAHFIFTACTYTHLRLNVVQTRGVSNPENRKPLAPFFTRSCSVYVWI